MGGEGLTVAALRSVRGKVVDDRGAARDLVEHSELTGDGRWADARFRLAVDQSHAARKVVRVVWPIALFGLVIAVVSMVGSGFGMSRTATWMILFPTILVINVIQHRMTAWKGVAGCAQVLASAAICPCCGYSLSGIPAESDGCVACPECGAAWKQERIVDLRPYEVGVRGATSQGHRWLGWLFGTGRSMSIKDEGGVLRALVSPALRREIAATDDAGVRRRLQAAARAMAKRGRPMRALLLVGLAILPLTMIGMTVVIWTTVGRAGAPAPAFTGLRWSGILPVFFTLLYLVMMVNVVRNRVGVSAKGVRLEMLRRDLCPCCAADISSASGESGSGTVKCPKCTAMWSLSG